MELYDLVILGGGPAGYNAAEKAAKGGLKTAVVEKATLGGVCVNEGCIPSKALLYSAKMLDCAVNSEKYGVTVQGAAIDQAKVIARKNKVVRTLTLGIAAKMKKLGVTVITAAGRVTGKSGDVFTVEAGEQQLGGKNLLIATGSAPVIPPIPGLREGLESGFVLTNREILDLTEIPAELVIIGGGVIGLEMASYYNSVGSKVTVVEMLNQIAGATDADAAQNLKKNYAKKGVTFCLGCKVTAVEDGRVIFENEKGETKEVAADKVLCSIGRRPVTDCAGVDELGLELSRGAIVTDEYMRTNVPGVYAAGDVNGRSMLAHTAYREGEVAVNNILGKEDKMRYNAIPSVIYTNPEVASVGLTPAEAEAKGIDFGCVNASMRYSGRYVAENEGGDGIMKLVYDKQKNTLLGVHMTGNHTSEIIYGAAMMIDTGIDIDRLKEIVFPHPTVGEVIREALFEI